MANSVIDTLTEWQDDASSLDTNLPTNATNMGDGQPGDLDGEFRRVKSEIRSESILKSWERWKGLKNLAATGNIAFTFVSGTSFTVNDNFTGVTRSVATVGRRVKALITATTLYGTITAATFSTPNTTVTVVWDSGALDATLTEVQFGIDLRAIRVEPLFRVKTVNELYGVPTLQGDNELGLQLEAGVFYDFEFMIYYQAATEVGFSFSVTGPSGANAIWNALGSFEPTAFGTFISSTQALGGQLNTTPSVSQLAVWIRGVIQNGANVGQLTIAWSPSSAGNMTVIAGSTIKAHKYHS